MKKICIIDSGYYAGDKNIRKEQIEQSLTIKKCEDEIIVLNGAEDQIGHGTAILTILQQENHNNNLYTIIKVFDSELECDEDILIYALQYVYENIECDLLNLSLGITCCTRKKTVM